MEWTFTLLRCDLLDILDLILNVLGGDGRCGGSTVGWDRRPSTVACSLLYKFSLGPGLKKAKGLCMAHKRSQFFTIQTDPKLVNNLFIFFQALKRKKHSQKELAQALL